MSRPPLLAVCLFVLIFTPFVFAAGPAPMPQPQLATLHPALVWQRVSPTPQHPDGPVLYQLLFNATGVPGTVAMFDTNPRHLANSHISDNGSTVNFGEPVNFASGQTFPDVLALNGGTMTGNITFAPTQTFPTSGGTVTSVASGLGLTGGPITSSGTLAINPAVVPQLGAADDFTSLLTFGGGTLHPPTGTATNTAGFNSNALDFTASSFNSLAGAAVNQRFRWQAEPVGNGTNSASGSLNLLFSAGGNPLAETGLSLASNGQFTFAGGQSFPGVLALTGGTMTGNITFAAGQSFPGTGTITGVTAGAGLGGGGTSGTVTLTNTGVLSVAAAAPLSSSGGQTPSISLTGIVPVANGGTGSATQNFVDLTTNQTISGNKTFNNTITGNVNLALPFTTSGGTAGLITLGGAPFLQNFGVNNTFVGQSAGNTSMNGNGNTAVGTFALGGNTTGSNNAAFGNRALMSNLGGLNNSAFGNQALFTNNSGSNNSAFGDIALFANTTGFSNAAFGESALSANTIGANNSAFGANALQANNDPNNSLNASSNSAFGANALASNTTGANNSGFGSGALGADTTGGSNAAFGVSALSNLTSGTGNIAVGSRAGQSFTAAESNNIDIGNAGVPGESNTIRIGTLGTQTAAFIAGNVTLPGTLTMGGPVTFAAGQSFPGTGTITGVTAGTGLTGGGTTGTVTLNNAGVLSVAAAGPLSSSGGQTPSISLTGIVPVANGGTGSSTQNFVDLITNQTIAGNKTFTNTLTANANLALPNTAAGGTAGVLTLGGVPFLHDFGANNTFVGANAGNFTTASGTSAFGSGALQSNTRGAFNAAFGLNALSANTINGQNSAFGWGALQHNNDSIFAANATANSAFGLNALNGNTSGSSNSAFGAAALQLNTTGSNNAAFGALALAANTADGNSAFGFGALAANTGGPNNAAFGFNALAANTLSPNNSAFGANALASNTGSSNSAFGFNALASSNMSFAINNSAFGANALVSSMGSDNTAFGSDALFSLVGGNSNIAIGSHAGDGLAGGENNNILIGNTGIATESNAIRIGDRSFQTAAFIAGITGVNVAGSAVMVNAGGQLGVLLSSRSYKQQIADIAGESDVLMKLRPVSFYYKPQYDAAHTRQYGLVAEEVAQVAPNLVIFDTDGQPQAVRYNLVNAMLLNEVQHQLRMIQAQQQANARQQELLQRQEQDLQQQQRQIAALRSQTRSASHQQNRIAQQQRQIDTLEAQLRQMAERMEAVEKVSGARPLRAGVASAGRSQQ